MTSKTYFWQRMSKNFLSKWKINVVHKLKLQFGTQENSFQSWGALKWVDLGNTGKSGTHHVYFYGL